MNMLQLCKDMRAIAEQLRVASTGLTRLCWKKLFTALKGVGKKYPVPGILGGGIKNV